MKKLLHIEDGLLKVESWLLVGVVGVMLTLATYNVIYRNVLVRWQAHLMTSGPPVTTPPPSDTPATPSTPEPGADPAAGFGGGLTGDDGAGGFGGGMADTPTDDGAAGFGGGMNAPPTPEPTPAPADDGAAGFGGGMADAPTDDGAAGFGGGMAGDDGAGGFGGGMAGDDGAAGFGGGMDSPSEPTPAPTPTATPEPAAPVGGPPLPGTFSALAASIIDAMKLDWIDILLRQLVLICGFFGAMIATRRKKHINIDALGKLLNPTLRRYVDVVTNLASVTVCIALTVAGAELVQVGLDTPSDLMSWAKDWQFQLAFPIGFGLLSLHFLVRTATAVGAVVTGESIEEDDEAAPAPTPTKPPPDPEPPDDAPSPADDDLPAPETATAPEAATAPAEPTPAPGKPRKKTRRSGKGGR